MSDPRIEKIREQHAEGWEATYDDVDHLLTKLDAAEGRERALIAGVTEALSVRVRKEGAEGYGLAFEDMLAILSRLLPSTSTEEGKSHE